MAETKMKKNKVKKFVQERYIEVYVKQGNGPKDFYNDFISNLQEDVEVPEESTMNRWINGKRQSIRQL